MEINKKSIRAFLEKKGWSIVDLAEKTGVAYGTAEGWFYGRKPNSSAMRIIEILMKEKK